MKRRPGRRAAVAGVLLIIVAPLSAIATNYATNASAPAIMTPLKQWPWQSCLILAAAGVLLTAWEWLPLGKTSRAISDRAISDDQAAVAIRFLANEVRHSWVDGILVPSLK